METPQLSRFITYPSVVDKTNNHTVLLIDATADELNAITDLFKQCEPNFDVYLYDGDAHELEYLNAVSANCDEILINDQSQVSVQPSGIRYGLNKEYVDPLAYFTKIIDETTKITV